MVVMAIVDVLRRGVFEPGDVLPPERDLAVELNVSRKTVREAIELLRRHDVVNVRRGSGGGTVINELGGVSAALATVAPEDPANLRALLEVRRALETSAALLLIGRVTDDDAAALRHLAAAFQDLVGQPGEFVEAELRFHYRLVALSGNTVCADLLRSVLDRISVIREERPYASVPQLVALRNQQAIAAAVGRRSAKHLLQALEEDLSALEAVLVGESLTPAASTDS
jgi:GntR family transcriptional repressor for pyruvate dehydrogenase complex